MEFNIKDRTHFLCVTGSHAFGTSTEHSDIDLKGYATPPVDYLLAYHKNFEQNDQKYKLSEYPFNVEVAWYATSQQFTFDPNEELDQNIYALKKFFKLAADCNPNIMSILFAHDADVLYLDEIAEEVRANKDAFLSAKARHTYSGYAVSQLKRIKTHRRWLLNPPDHKPTRKEFGLPETSTIPADQRAAAEKLVNKLIREWLLQEAEIERSVLFTIQQNLSEFIATLDPAYQNMEETARLTAMKQIGMTDNYISILQAEKGYKARHTEWKQYQEWVKTRNPARADLEARYGYDCYSCETEFLTDNGWKYFDEITNADKLATVRINNKRKDKKNLTVEYQKFSERFDSKFNGNLYNFYGNHMSIRVTPNHKMLYRKKERKSKRTTELQFSNASNVPDTFEIIQTITPTKTTYNNKKYFENISIPPDIYLKVMGWFLSDGTFTFRNKKPKSIRISQIKGGKLHWHLSRFVRKYKNQTNCSVYTYKREMPAGKFRKKSETITEIILDIRNPIIVNKLYKDCGHKKEKRIPRWVFGLSKRLMETLFNALILGDGTARKQKESFIYYSSSKSLADNVQELAFFCGWVTSLYVPFTGCDRPALYHVAIIKNARQFKQLIRNKNIEIEKVQNHRIVCFTVPNHTLITRHNGQIAIQGNCKHAYHLVRLIRMAKEILLTGEVIVKRPDAAELSEIRNGSWEYDKLIAYADEMDKELEEIYRNKKYVIPHKPNVKFLGELCTKLHQKVFAKDEKRKSQ